MNKNWGSVVFVGGKSARMGGRDKASLRLKNESFIDVAVNRVKLSVAEVVLSVGSKQRPGECLHQLVDMNDAGNEIGPVGGMLSAIDWAKQNNLAGFAIVPVDTPVLRDDIFEFLVKSNISTFAVQNSRSHWLHAAWPQSVFSSLKMAIEVENCRSIRSLHNYLGSQAVEIPQLHEDEFKNINTPSDLERLYRHGFVTLTALSLVSGMLEFYRHVDAVAHSHFRLA